VPSADKLTLGASLAVFPKIIQPKHPAIKNIPAFTLHLDISNAFEGVNKVVSRKLTPLSIRKAGIIMKINSLLDRDSVDRAIAADLRHGRS
jgi:hypothetical protein